MSTPTKITEACGCGATFTYTGEYSAQKAATEWRVEHRHIEPPQVGICGDRGQPIILAEGESTPVSCGLPAGHLGMHSDGDGCHWSRP